MSKKSKRNRQTSSTAQSFQAQGISEVEKARLLQLKYPQGIPTDQYQTALHWVENDGPRACQMIWGSARPSMANPAQGLAAKFRNGPQEASGEGGGQRLTAKERILAELQGTNTPVTLSDLKKRVGYSRMTLDQATKALEQQGKVRLHMIPPAHGRGAASRAFTVA